MTSIHSLRAGSGRGSCMTWLLKNLHNRSVVSRIASVVHASIPTLIDWGHSAGGCVFVEFVR